MEKERHMMINDFRLHEKDTGSVELQIVLLTEEINELMKHFEKHVHDFHSKRGMLKKVNRRRKFLEYVKRRNKETYQKLIAQLGLRK